MATFYTPPVSAPPESQPQVFNNVGLDEQSRQENIRVFLSSHKFPTGLIETFIKNLEVIPIRYFIIDDSGSMANSDGHKLIKVNNKNRFVPCTRFEELALSIGFHAELAYIARAPSEFRFLNLGTPITIGYGDLNEDKQRLDIIRGMLTSSPNGGTPLCSHIFEITRDIESKKAALSAKGQKAAVIIASDGEATDGHIINAMKPLQSLPAWVVIRLCTDDDNIANYWNNVDNEIELPMDVLDDFQSEAKEVVSLNPWLTYCEPIHKTREFGVLIKEFDLLDEKKMTLGEIKNFIHKIVLGQSLAPPDPHVEYNKFIGFVHKHGSSLQWDPISLTDKPIINTKKIPNPNGGCSIS